MDEEFITKTELKERGWTDSIIKSLNVEPDEERPNPKYKSASPMKLYKLEKIKSLEATPEFEQLYEKSLKRRASAEKAVETKREKLIEFAENVKIEVRYMPEPQLTRNAISAYNSWNVEKIYSGKCEAASTRSDEIFLIRIRNNYIRHQLTNYDAILAQIRSKVGTHEVYDTIREKIAERINHVWKEKSSQGDNINNTSLCSA